MEHWVRQIVVRGMTFEVRFSRRPFREGCCVEVTVDDELLSFSELGFGESDVLQRVREAIEERLDEGGGGCSDPRRGGA